MPSLSALRVGRLPGLFLFASTGKTIIRTLLAPTGEACGAGGSLGLTLGRASADIRDVVGDLTNDDVAIGEDEIRVLAVRPDDRTSELHAPEANGDDSRSVIEDVRRDRVTELFEEYVHNFAGVSLSVCCDEGDGAFSLPDELL